MPGYACRRSIWEDGILKDTEILDLYFARDEQAIAQTQSKYGTYCFSIAFHILHDQEDSDECVNDTWMRAWNSIPPNRPDHLNIFHHQKSFLGQIQEKEGHEARQR